MAAVKNFTLDQGSDKTVSFILSDKNGPLDRTRAPQASHFNGR